MRKLIAAIVLSIGVLYIILKFAEVQAIAGTLQKGDWRFLLLALGVILLWMVANAFNFRYIYLALGIYETFKKLFLMSTAVFFVNVVAPSVGMGGVAVFVSEARRSGNSPGRVTLAGMLYVLIDYLGFLIVLVAGLFVLFRRNHLSLTEIIASGILILICAFLSSLLVLGLRSGEALGRALSWLASRINRLLQPFIHREYLSVHRARVFAYEVNEGLQAVRRKPEAMLMPLILALVSKILLIAILMLMFLAFGVPYSPGTIIGGFSIAYLFVIVSLTPAGLGVVEGAMTLTLNTLNVPIGAAAVLTLVYRGFTFWVPLFVGMLSFRRLAQKETSQTAALMPPPVPKAPVGTSSIIEEEGRLK